MQKQYDLTEEGLAKLEAELHQLQTVRRTEVAEKIKRAKETGGTDHNADYEEAKNEQAFVEGHILELEDIIKNAVVISHRQKASRVEMGSEVTVIDQDNKTQQYTIVGSAEANPLEGRISNQSPVGHALLGKKAGDKVGVKAPGGTLHLHITQVR
ncbi:MAG: transcription elongation factor GreA [Dehalococcoidia bacterium]